MRFKSKGVGSLQHYGIKGMRWGKRKGSTADSKVRSERKAASKARRTLSDADIEKRIARLQSEKKLKELTAADISPGRSIVKDILSTSGQKAAKTIASAAVLVAVQTALTGKFDPKAAAKHLNPKK